LAYHRGESDFPEEIRLADLARILRNRTRHSIMSRFAICSVCAVLLTAGCATYDPAKHYDPNATEKVGRITEKAIAKYELREAADNKPSPYPLLTSSLPVNAVSYITAATFDILRRREASIPIYAYMVDADSEKAVVYSEYPAFEVGDCVKLFLSSRPDYPRIAPWSC
jgi:hypothetical protein